jgi:hypothetical protein
MVAFLWLDFDTVELSLARFNQVCQPSVWRLLRERSGGAPTCSGIGNLQMLRRRLYQLGAPELPQLLDPNPGPLWLS